MNELKPCPMTLTEAIAILHPDTTLAALAKVEYYAGFNGVEAKVKACEAACDVACEVMQRELDRRAELENMVTVEELEQEGRAGYASGYADGIAKSREPNEALTLDELRGMDGEPVWIASNSRPRDDAWCQYAYEEHKYDLIAYWEFGSETESAFCVSDYGKTWIAYRHKPEECK